ncbi:uncharacterized protein [Physcomitrium patens]|uniref:LOB domain-containing protein n=2 Tax=Physcomitrium patens TaxID=3218 RepID=A0A7I4AFA5_PHYPA|nr:LOB domain-containing protein 6-like isoform X1 [Physcomitrium patens]|eukprot:XP_024390323.1 LOB domain-containing protein 6-like isoform X1 [Physcomitrella patens]
MQRLKSLEDFSKMTAPPKISPPGERSIVTGGAGPSSSGPSAGANAACAACKYQRRKCATDCPLAPYFPPDQPKRFLNVHRLFGVSSILRILRQVDPEKREDTVKSIVYEADTREKDPVHGCLGVIRLLQNQVNKLKDEVVVAREQLYLMEQQHTSSILQQNYGHQHAGGQADYHHYHLQPQYRASTSHQGGSFHDPAHGQNLTYQDSRSSHGAYSDHARYLVDSDSDLHGNSMLGQQIIKVESTDPYNRSSMGGGIRYGSDSGLGSLLMHEHQNRQNLADQHQQGGPSYAVAGDLERRPFYNPLIDTHVGRHVDSLRSMAALQGLDPLNPPQVSDHELRNAGVHLSLTNKYSI